MSYDQSVGFGRVQASETDIILNPKNYMAAKRGVLYCHGRESGNAACDWQKYERAKIVSGIAKAGYIVLSCDMGGNNTWGNSTAVTRIGTAATYLLGLNVLPTKIAIVGQSMGGISGLNWIAQNLSSCSCFIGNISGLDLTDTHTNNRGGYASEINTAYGGTYSEASFGATYNPQTRATAGAFGSLPIQLWYADSDTTFPAAQSTAFKSAVGASCEIWPMNGAHAESTLDLVRMDALLGFLAAAG